MSRKLLAVLLGLAALRLVLAAILPLAPDEAYYWIWSRDLAPSYFDHPPMVAFWIRASTALVGQGALGVRLFGPLAGLVGSVALARAAADFFPDRPGVPNQIPSEFGGIGARAALLLNATMFLGIGVVVMTPDTPLLFFWTLALWALGRLHRTGKPGWWVVAGLATGGAMLSKYTAVLLPASIGLWLILLPEGRAWLRRPAPWAALALAAASFAPVVEWNAANGWASFARQGGRTEIWHAGRAVGFLGELVGAQLGLATPLVFGLCVAGVWVLTRLAWRQRDAGAALLVLMVLLPSAVFLEHALGDRVQGNWPAVIYPAAVIAAAALPGRFWRSACWVGFAMAALIYVQALTGILHLPITQDPTLLRLAGWPGLARQVEAQARAQGATYVAVDQYGIAAELARNLPPDLPVVGVGPRWAYFTLPSAIPVLDGRRGILVQTARHDDPPDRAPWRSLELVGMAERGRSGMVAETFRIWDVMGSDAPATVLLPRPDGHNWP